MLVVNPGSTSTKVAVYEGDQETWSREIQHTGEELAPFAGRRITDQYDFRRQAVLRAQSIFCGEKFFAQFFHIEAGFLRLRKHVFFFFADVMLDLFAQDLDLGVEHRIVRFQ